jgi:ParB family transcriptional regulator, chromosome partitioning protein
MSAQPRTELLHIPIDEIIPNPQNPRLIFDQDRMDRLAESLSEVGILVPLIVFRDEDGHYVLLDGERRWRCARKLNFKDVPANIVAMPSKIENILRMFNIHNVREDWELMPTALKLEQLMEELNTTNERRLSELTSLTIGTIRRCKTLLSLSNKYQKALLAGAFKPDFFIEMEGAINKIEHNLPDLYSRYGKNGLVDSFVEMQKEGKINAVTDFRLFEKVLDSEKIGFDHKSLESLVERVISKHEISLIESYAIIEDFINISQIETKTIRLVETFRSFDYRRLKQPEKDRFRSTLIELKDTIEAIIKAL